MKKILFIVTTIAWAVMGQATDYVTVGKPICVEGKQWVYEVQFDEKLEFEGQTYTRPGNKTSMVIEFKGDTVIDGETFKKCWRTYGRNATITSKLYKLKFGQEREREITDVPVVIGYCKDYQFPIDGSTSGGSSQVRVIYSDQYKKEMCDYNAGTHQLISDDPDLFLLWQVPMRCYLQEYGTGSSKDYRVMTLFFKEIRINENERKYYYDFTRVETEDIDGEPRVKLVGNADKIFSNYYSFWIDGIGYVFNTKGYFAQNRGGLASNLISPLGTYNDLSIETCLSHVVENGEIIYKSPDFQEWLVTVTDVNEVKVTTHETADGAYYNLQGQRVDNPSPGIYIHNGKKVVVK